MTARYRTAWTFAITSAALFMASLDNLVVTTALPSIRAHLHASLEGLQWTVNAYTLTFAVLLLTGATLGERYGRRRLFTIGLGLFTAGSAAAAMAPGIGALSTRSRFPAAFPDQLADFRCRQGCHKYDFLDGSAHLQHVSGHLLPGSSC